MGKNHLEENKILDKDIYLKHEMLKKIYKTVTSKKREII